MRLDFRGKTRVYINKPYTNKETYRKRRQRLRRDFEAQTRKICTAATPPHVPEVYLTVTREILRVSARKNPQSRVYMAHAKRALAVRKYKEAGELTHSVSVVCRRNTNDTRKFKNFQGCRLYEAVRYAPPVERIRWRSRLYERALLLYYRLLRARNITIARKERCAI